MLTIGSLFSGIGGLELGLERAGLGPVLWQVEINPYARAVLAAHWPKARRFHDIQEIDSTTLAPVDLVCGGFPCQDISSAGKRAGLRGTRSGLWAQFRRIVGELRPQWVVVENVASGAAAWVDAVAGELERLRYAVLPVPLAAADVGAPHERRRVFLVAYADGQGKPAQPKHAQVAAAPAATTHAQRDRIRHEPRRRSRQNGAGARIAADTCSAAWREPMPNMVRVADGLPARLDGARARIHALGNAVVPQCAEVVGHII